MSGLEIVAWVFILLLFKPVLDEIRTLMQIIKSFFVVKVNLKERYGDWAVVTGCTDGIGKAYTFQLAKRGINIILISRNPDKLQQVAEDVESRYNVKTKVIVADFSEGSKVYENIKEGLKGFEIGILVNNVGIFTDYPKLVTESSPEEMWGFINVNIGAAALLTQMLLPEMVARKKGAIVNMSSAAKLTPAPLANMYSASKIFLEYFTETLRAEHRGSGLTFQLLCPFFVSTKIVHFSDQLGHVNIFTPTPGRYAKHAVETLGVIDNTTGYWPHRLQYFVAILSTVWFRTYAAGIIVRYVRNEYFNKNPNIKKVR